jgi:hypothetical protein
MAANVNKATMVALRAAVAGLGIPLPPPLPLVVAAATLGQPVPRIDLAGQAGQVGLPQVGLPVYGAAGLPLPVGRGFGAVAQGPVGYVQQQQPAGFYGQPVFFGGGRSSCPCPRGCQSERYCSPSEDGPSATSGRLSWGWVCHRQGRRHLHHLHPDRG